MSRAKTTTPLHKHARRSAALNRAIPSIPAIPTTGIAARTPYPILFLNPAFQTVLPDNRDPTDPRATAHSLVAGDQVLDHPLRHALHPCVDVLRAVDRLTRSGLGCGCNNGVSQGKDEAVLNRGVATRATRTCTPHSRGAGRHGIEKPPSVKLPGCKPAAVHSVYHRCP